ncbi:MAG: Na+/H+ antiporter NhaC family protein, partial [Planctomycetes bacterium]|nr:Na+/H+ antiporter NhaC family protein [Planctomycetota bacterium]
SRETPPNAPENPDIPENPDNPAAPASAAPADGTPPLPPAREPRLKALVPFFVFVAFYVGIACWARDCYAVPMTAAFLVASATALLLNRHYKLAEKVEVFARGMGDSNIMTMCLIFILSGAFAAVAKHMGAVDAAVLIARHLIPAWGMLAGVFLVACGISLAIGTSCGTIAALTPIAIGLVGPMGIPAELLLGAVVGGAMFGDNLSMISDTTIAATRTQGVEMRDKFLANFRIVVPAAILCVVAYLCLGRSGAPAPVEPLALRHLLLVAPYCLILALALLGLNVMALLFFGIVLAAAIGTAAGSFSGLEAIVYCGKGTLDMAETLIVAILAGGLLAVIRWNGGVSWLLNAIGRVTRGPRACEAGVLALVAAINLFTANNTVAIVIAGPIAKRMGDSFHCRPRRIASLLDTGSCLVQGLIPYGAQILTAIGVATASGMQVSSLHLVGSMHYQFLVALMLVLSIVFQRHPTAATAAQA